MTNPIGWALLAAAVATLVAAFLVHPSLVFLSLAFGVGAMFFEKDYPSGF